MSRQAAVDQLLAETAAALQRSAGNTEALRGAVFLFLNRAYEAGLEPDAICDLLGVAHDNVVNRARLSKADEAAVMDAYETLDPILEQQYNSGAREE